MTNAICIRCGAAKQKPQERCPNCHFRPESDIDKARSLSLSIYCELDDEYCGPNPEDFPEVQEMVRARVYAFDDILIEKIIHEANQATSVSPMEIFVAGVKWLAWPIIIVVALLILGRFH